MSILLPLQIEKGQLTQAKNPKEAIDAFIELLLTTPCQSCVADRQFGFIFNNLKFEIFNENEGVIYNSATEEEDLRTLRQEDFRLLEKRQHLRDRAEKLHRDLRETAYQRLRHDELYQEPKKNTCQYRGNTPGNKRGLQIHDQPQHLELTFSRM